MPNEWYHSLTRPPLAPPDWLFGPVWTVLYILIAIALVLFVRAYRRLDEGVRPRWVVWLWVAHLISNAAWTPIFFGLQAPWLALLDILFLIGTLVILVRLLWRIAPLASVLLWPYLAWVSFASYLNFGYAWLNR